MKITDEIQNLKAEYKKLDDKIETISKELKKEPIKEERVLYSGAVYLENINGKLELLTDTVSHIPRNFKEQVVLVETNSKYYLGVTFKDKWLYLNATSSL